MTVTSSLPSSHSSPPPSSSLSSSPSSSSPSSSLLSCYRSQTPSLSLLSCYRFLSQFSTAVLQQCCSNNLSTGCVRTACSQLVDKLSTACWQLATRLLSSTDLLQVVPTTCYRPAIQQYIRQQVVSDNLVAI
jgi:hypothetical protein